MTKKKEAVATVITAEPTTKNEVSTKVNHNTPVVAAQDNQLAGVIAMLERVVSNPDYPIEKVEQAFNFMQRVEADRAKKAWTRAFVAAGAKFEQVRKDATSDKGAYASFDAIDAATRPVLREFGMHFTHTTEPSAHVDYVKVVSYLVHEEGHRERYEIDMPADGKGAKGNDVQTKTHAVASAMTYGKRYNVGNACNIATYKDDDGNAASKGAKSRPVLAPMEISDSAAKRIVIIRELHTLKRPLFGQELEDFATKHGATVDALRPEDSKHVRDEITRWMRDNDDVIPKENIEKARQIMDDGL